MIITRTHRLLTAGAAMCLGGTLFVGLGGLPFLVRACESPLEFVGNLIGNVHRISLDRLDPTCPQCF
ncbi:MAG: hypothetical protein JWM43_2692 [Acidobacteriaceae bacterium]|nr:hypothetical protein [Acidobacteriaceae bacterium]